MQLESSTPSVHENACFETPPCQKQSRGTDQVVFEGTPLVPLDLHDIEIPQIS